MAPHGDPSVGARRRPPAPLVVAAGVLLLAVVAMPLADVALPTIPGFSPAWASLLFAFALLATLLLLNQYVVRGGARVLVLAVALMWEAAISLLYGFAIPGMMSVDGVFAEGTNSVQVLWLERHVGPSLLVGLALAPWPRRLEQRVARDADRRRTALVVLAACVGLGAVGGLLVDRLGEDLPLVRDPATDRVMPWVVALLLVANLGALVAAVTGLWRRRGASGIEQWGAVYVAACLGDIGLTLLYAERYSVGYYLARSLALATSVTIVVAMLTQIASLHRRVRHDAVVLEHQNAELRDSASLRAHLMAIVSHDLRTPLAGLQGYLELLQDESTHEDPEFVRRMHERSWLLARRLTLLTEDLLAVATLEHGDLVITPAPLDLRSELDLCVQVFPDLLIGVDCPEGLVVEADPLRLQQVLGNLVRNAQKHGAEPVVVAAERRPGVVAIKVSDAGPGVPADFEPRLFERYTQVVAGSAGGSGLGLSVVRDLVAGHGGSVAYERETNTFVVELPDPSPLLRRGPGTTPVEVVVSGS